MPESVYKASQLPDFCNENVIRWTGDDFIIVVEGTEDGKSEIFGESLEYNNDIEDWGGTPLTRNECIDIATKEELVVPTDVGIKKFTDIYKME